MNAPTYRLFLHTPMPIRTGPFRWAWTVGDGYVAHLGHGEARTLRAAMRARDAFAETCQDWETAALADVVEQLHADGIDVTARLDERRRVCVRPACACSDRDHRRVMLAFARVIGPVRWETEAQPQGQATGSTGVA